MRTTRRNFLAVLAAFPALSKLKVEASQKKTPGGGVSLEPRVQVGDRLIDFKDLIVTHTLGGDENHATFKTLSGPVLGDPIRITLGTDVLFSGRVQRWTLHRGPYGPLYYDVVAQHFPCEKPPEGWFCSRDRGHDGPCAAMAEVSFLANYL
jgi:hypothetical protein